MRVMCKPGSVGDLGGQPPRSTRPGFLPRTDTGFPPYRISPFEVESALVSHSAVLEAAAVESPDPLRGMVVKAFIVLREGCSPSDSLAEQIQEHVKRMVAPYKYPRRIQFVSALPKTISGKIKRRELRELECACAAGK